jgi:hypothetical protein
MYQTLNYWMDIQELNCANHFAQTWTEPPGAGYSWNRYSTNGPKTEPFLTLGMRLHRDCNAIGDTTNISSRIPSTCAQHAIISSLIMHITPSQQIYVGINNPSLIPSVSCLNTCRDLWNSMCAVDDVSHAGN